MQAFKRGLYRRVVKKLNEIYSIRIKSAFDDQLKNYNEYREKSDKITE